MMIMCEGILADEHHLSVQVGRNGKLLEIWPSSQVGAKAAGAEVECKIYIWDAPATPANYLEEQHYLEMKNYPEAPSDDSSLQICLTGDLMTARMRQLQSCGAWEDQSRLLENVWIWHRIIGRSCKVTSTRNDRRLRVVRTIIKNQESRHKARSWLRSASGTDRCKYVVLV